MSSLAARDFENVEETHPGFSKDHLLQVYRRLDWRFLLPDPDVERIAYLGPENSVLLDALLTIDRNLAHNLAFQVSNEDPEDFNLVVVKNPSFQTLTLAEKMVKPGGHLYVEAYGWSRLAKPRQLLNQFQSFLKKEKTSAVFWSPSHCKSVISHFRFSSVQTYWHWPNFESCTKIIPFDASHAQTFAYSFQEYGYQRVIKKAILRGLLPPGWAQFWVSNFSVIAEKEMK